MARVKHGLTTDQHEKIAKWFSDANATLCKMITALGGAYPKSHSHNRKVHKLYKLVNEIRSEMEHTACMERHSGAGHMYYGRCDVDGVDFTPAEHNKFA